MRLITNSVVPGRWEHSRTPPDGGELSSTTILKVRVVSGSGKIREGGPGDDKKDMENGDVADKYWTGVVPIWVRTFRSLFFRFCTAVILVVYFSLVMIGLSSYNFLGTHEIFLV